MRLNIMSEEDRSNEDRINDARRSLSAHLGVLPADPYPEDDITDLVTNLMHLMYKHDINIDGVIAKARNHFEVENAMTNTEAIDIVVKAARTLQNPVGVARMELALEYMQSIREVVAE